MAAPPPLISVIVPTLNEEAVLGRALSALGENQGPLEILLADGGSSDGTLQVAEGYPEVRVIASPRGRGPQMNRGAAEATGPILWFLHADCVPPPEAACRIRVFLAGHPEAAGGAFRFALDRTTLAYRIIEFGVWLRAEVLGIPYGDQGFFMWRRLFDRIGGYPDLARLEDLYFLKRWRRHGRIGFLSTPLPTSSRRWDRLGPVMTTLRNWTILGLYRLGASHRTLERLL